jgi:hypothetical protein
MHTRLNPNRITYTPLPFHTRLDSIGWRERREKREERERREYHGIM